MTDRKYRTHFDAETDKHWIYEPDGKIIASSDNGWYASEITRRLNDNADNVQWMNKYYSLQAAVIKTARGYD